MHQRYDTCLPSKHSFDTWELSRNTLNYLFLFYYDIYFLYKVIIKIYIMIMIY